MKTKSSVRHFDNLNNKYPYHYPLYLISVSAKRISQNNEYLTSQIFEILLLEFSIIHCA